MEAGPQYSSQWHAVPNGEPWRVVAESLGQSVPRRLRDRWEGLSVTQSGEPAKRQLELALTAQAHGQVHG